MSFLQPVFCFSFFSSGGSSSLIPYTYLPTYLPMLGYHMCYVRSYILVILFLF
ncbi:hypothetical protein BDW42DRAFT_165915 [Aspergillus taichungensis]|uniref:Uncharacterized protein n=1 Tax=Aspergillus taichungensis TaxID=482145 RepID=A0A2J5HZV8_9EURO|nr:hypothetical protein BDW42DRAFT_165915 [Aspergillus taichungensis]